MIGESWHREDVARGHMENLKVEQDALFRARAFTPALLAVSRWSRTCFGTLPFNVVEIGCGGGAYAIPFTSYLGAKYKGIDPSEAMIAEAKAYHEAKFPRQNLRFSFSVGGFAEGLSTLIKTTRPLLFVCGSAEYTNDPMSTMLDCMDAVLPGDPFVFHKLRLDRSKVPTGQRFTEPTYAGQSDLFWLWSLPMVYDLLQSYPTVEFAVFPWPSNPRGCVTIGGRKT